LEFSVNTPGSLLRQLGTVLIDEYHTPGNISLIIESLDVTNSDAQMTAI
jgi:hypothetical protein